LLAVLLEVRATVVAVEQVVIDALFQEKTLVVELVLNQPLHYSLAHLTQSQ
jgi:hypothetical protein